MILSLANFIISEQVYYQLRRKIMGYYLGKTEARPTSQENTEYVKLFNLYVWNVKDTN